MTFDFDPGVEPGKNSLQPDAIIFEWDGARIPTFRNDGRFYLSRAMVVMGGESFTLSKHAGGLSFWKVTKTQNDNASTWLEAEEVH